MDANGSRYHALVTEHDWIGAPDEDGKLAWREGAGLVLKPLLFEFRPAKAGLLPLDEPGSRAGGVFDQAGNLYALAPDGLSVTVRSAGSGTVSTFWPVEGRAPHDGMAAVQGFSRGRLAAAAGPFEAVLPAADPALVVLDALTVTTGHYLVCGSIAASGLLIFDLHGAGPPLFQAWPGMPAPQALIALADGGLGLLSDGRLHRLGPDLRPCLWGADASPSPFASAAVAGADVVAPAPCLLDLRPALGADAHVGACCALDAERLLVLGTRAGETQSRLGVIGLDGKTWPVLRGDALHGPLPSLSSVIAAAMAREDGEPAPQAALSLHSLAVAWPIAGQMQFIVLSAGGDQAFAFDAHWQGEQLLVKLRRDYLPLRRYQGGGLASLPPGLILHAYPAARLFYAASGRWVPLLALPQPRCEREALLDSPLWDSGLPGCVWHRVALDVRRPPGALIRLQSRAADQPEDLAKLPWRDEPLPLAHPRGSELPWREGLLQNIGCLLQDARGRWLQLRLLIGGDGQQSPVIARLRAWYPRFSYLREYLPPVYREDAVGAGLMDRLLALFEGEFTRWEDRIAAAQLLLDARTAPAETLEWLAGWVALAFDPASDETRRRLLLRHATRGHARRGTVPGLLLAATLAWDPDNSEAEAWMLDPQALDERPHGLRLQELFGLLQPLPVSAWRPAQGLAALLLRLEGERALAPEDAAQQQRLQESLGYLPRGAQEEAWLQQAWALAQLPADEPVASKARAYWDRHLRSTQACAPLRQRWQDFLARRWRRIARLNEAWGTRWLGFERIPSFTSLPGGAVALADWHLFESRVLRGLAAANRFRIVLPLPTGPLDVDALARRRAAVWRAIERDKPAHTVAELRYGFELFRVGEARLGLDTRLEEGLIRRPGLAALVLGRNDLGGALLAPARPLPPPDRIGLDRGQ